METQNHDHQIRSESLIASRPVVPVPDIDAIIDHTRNVFSKMGTGSVSDQNGFVNENYMDARFIKEKVFDGRVLLIADEKRLRQKDDVYFYKASAFLHTAFTQSQTFRDAFYNAKVGEDGVLSAEPEKIALIFTRKKLSTDGKTMGKSSLESPSGIELIQIDLNAHDFVFGYGFEDSLIHEIGHAWGNYRDGSVHQSGDNQKFVQKVMEEMGYRLGLFREDHKYGADDVWIKK